MNKIQSQQVNLAAENKKKSSVGYSAQVGSLWLVCMFKKPWHLSYPFIKSIQEDFSKNDCMVLLELHKKSPKQLNSTMTTIKTRIEDEKDPLFQNPHLVRVSKDGGSKKIKRIISKLPLTFLLIL